MWAGRLTPHANVAVEINNYMCPSWNKSSTNNLSDLAMPAWWIAIPSGKSSLRDLFLMSEASFSNIILEFIWFFKSFDN